MSKILHMTPAEYAEVLRFAGNAAITEQWGDFNAYVAREYGAEYYTDNQIHVVREIKPHANVPDGDRHWKWCPRCKKFTNIDWMDRTLYSQRLESLTAELSGRPAR